MIRQHAVTLSDVILLALGIFSLSSARAEEAARYKHPTLDFQFSASGRWESYPRPEDDLIYEMFDRETGIHVMLWYTATQQSAKRYVQKMADMTSVVVDEREPLRRKIADREAWLYDVSAAIRGEAVHTIQAVIDGGADGELADHNALYVVQIWCPAARHPSLGREMETILASVSIGGAR